MSPPGLLLAVNDFPPALGGEAALYHALARHLPPGEGLVLAPRQEGDREIDAGLRVEVVRRPMPVHRGTLSRVARALAGGAHLMALARRRTPRYLVCGQLLSLGVPGRIVARALRIPYAVFVHGADLEDYHDRVPWGGLLRWAIGGADAVIVNSGFTRDLVERRAPGRARRIVVMPMGVDPPPAPDGARVEALRRRYGLGGGEVLLSVSRLVAMKGHDVAIAALPRLARRFGGLRYLVVGTGPERARLERQAADLGAGDRVIFAGAVPQADLSAHYRLATLFVQLSRATGRYDGLEGFGLSLLEAASHGLPSIAGRSGGVPEAVRDGHTGCLVPPGDPAAFALAAGRLLADRGERARMAGAALQWAAAHPWSASARCLLGLAMGAGRCAA